MPGTWIDKIVGNCRIEEKIGEGGCGQVYRGVDLMLDRPVAIKVLHAALAERSDVTRRFRSEAHTLARLSHPNVATLYAFHREGDAYLMVMEYVEGETLEARLQRGGPMSVGSAIPLLLQAFDGIHHAHQHGVVHRDLKSSNLMVNAAGGVKVMDFGVARAAGFDGQTQADQPIGTPEYMSPEQVRGEEIDARSDVYSLGVLIFKLLSGALPITGPSPFEVMRAQVERAPRSLREVVPDVPESIERAVARALRKDPAERFESVEALGAELERSLDGVAVNTTAPREAAAPPRSSPPDLEPTAVIPVPRPRWRGGARRAMSAAALAALCLGVGWHGDRSAARALATAAPVEDPFVAVRAVAAAPPPAWTQLASSEPVAAAAPARVVEVEVEVAPVVEEVVDVAPAPGALPESDRPVPAAPGWVIRR